MADPEFVVEMLGVRKEFPGIVANDDITLCLRKGEVHALLGENGAGKSTLMSILFGLYQPDKGSIRIRGKDVRIDNPNIANDLGIGMVHQHFKLVHNFTVTENIVLGIEPTSGLVLSLKEASQRIKTLSQQYGLNVEPDARIEDISVGMQQRVEILKMLYRNAEVLIFDEPTAVLTPQEIQDLLKIMRNLIDEGKSIILITHKLREIKAIADRCTVIRRGKYVGTVDVKDTDEARMAEMMVGRQVSFKVEKSARSVDDAGEVILSLRNLRIPCRRKGDPILIDALDIRAGEIVGLAGVEGNGQTELVEALTGLRRVESGSMVLSGKDIANASIRERNESGLAHIPEDRQKRGLVLDYTLEENFILKNHRDEPYSSGGFLHADAIRAHADKVIAAFDVRTPGPGTAAGALSGGNLQKFVIGREVLGRPRVLVVNQPTWGVDAGATAAIRQALLDLAAQGAGVIVISQDLDELLELSDRFCALNEGRLSAPRPTEGLSVAEIGLMLGGAHGMEVAHVPA